MANVSVLQKTGQTPESVGEMIQFTVKSSPSDSPDTQPQQVCPAFASLFDGGLGEMGHGHVTECLTVSLYIFYTNTIFFFKT